MIKIKQRKLRQRLRMAAIVLSLLLFPITINYLSPYIIIDGASQGIINGSFIMFALLLVSALVLGRLWCAWVCPGAGLQEIAFPINNKRARTGRWDLIKWVIWFIWIGAIVAAAVYAGGYRTVNFFHLTDSGISVDHPEGYFIYYTVVGIFLLLSITAGRRAGCHYICWMAPFMIIGRKIRNLVNWPALRLKADQEKCNDCKRCTRECPMSLDVNEMVLQSKMEHNECILCGTCIDECPLSAISYSFSSGK